MIEPFFALMRDNSVFEIGDFDESKEDYFDEAYFEANKIALENDTSVAFIRSMYDINELIWSLMDLQNERRQKNKGDDELIQISLIMSKKEGDFELFENLIKEYPHSEFLQSIETNIDIARSTSN